MTPPVTLERLTPEERAALQKLAEAATPGQWTGRRAVMGMSENLIMDAPATVVHQWQDEQGRRCTAFVAACSATSLENDANAAYIAAANPSTLLRLLAEIERLTDALETQKGVADRHRMQSDVCHDERLPDALKRAEAAESERDAALAQVQEAETRAWQPIETAPKDGTRFIALLPDGEVIACHWDTEYQPPAWATKEGFYAPKFNHWQPLPPPPARLERPHD